MQFYAGKNREGRYKACKILKVYTTSVAKSKDGESYKS